MPSESGDVIKNRHDRAPDHSTVSIQDGGQKLIKNQEWPQFRGPIY